MKRKEQAYFGECVDWQYEDIRMLTGVNNMDNRRLN